MFKNKYVKIILNSRQAIFIIYRFVIDIFNKQITKNPQKSLKHFTKLLVDNFHLVHFTNINLINANECQLKLTHPLVELTNIASQGVGWGGERGSVEGTAVPHMVCG